MVQQLETLLGLQNQLREKKAAVEKTLHEIAIQKLHELRQLANTAKGRHYPSVIKNPQFLIDGLGAGGRSLGRGLILDISQTFTTFMNEQRQIVFDYHNGHHTGITGQIIWDTSTEDLGTFLERLKGPGEDYLRLLNYLRNFPSLSVIEQRILEKLNTEIERAQTELDFYQRNYFDILGENEQHPAVAPPIAANT